MDITIRLRQPLLIPKPMGALSMKHSSASLIAIGFRWTSLPWEAGVQLATSFINHPAIFAVVNEVRKSFFRGVKRRFLLEKNRRGAIPWVVRIDRVLSLVHSLLYEGATVYHRYLRRGESAPAPGREDADALKAKKAAADLEFVEEKKRQVVARRMETEIRNLRSKRELIPKTLVQKQAAFLVLSLRARLLAIPAQHADELLGISNRHEMTRRLDSIIRSRRWPKCR